MIRLIVDVWTCEQLIHYRHNIRHQTRAQLETLKKRLKPAMVCLKATFIARIVLSLMNEVELAKDSIHYLIQTDGNDLRSIALNLRLIWPEIARYCTILHDIARYCIWRKKPLKLRFALRAR